MNRMIAAFLSTIMFASTPLFGNCSDNQMLQYPELVMEDSILDDQVIYLLESEVTDTINIEEWNLFVDSGGIIVVTNEKDVQNDIANLLEFPVSIAAEDNAEEDNAEANLVDLATLYYRYGDGLSGVCLVRANENADSEEIIEEAIYDIKQRQAETDNTPQIEMFGMPRSSSYTSRTIGICEVRNTDYPYGRFDASYEVFTVQEYNDRDYYIIKAVINGYPGSDLADTNSNYEEKYQGENMNVVMESTTSSVTVDRYGPETTTSSSTYSVNIGGSFSPDTGLINAWGLSYSRNRENKKITATGSPSLREWDVKLSGSVQKVLCTFEPGITFVCPSNKTAIDVSVTGEYKIDAWDTSPYYIDFSKTIECTPTNAEFQ